MLTDCYKSQNFFKLPLKNIYSVISNIKFNSINESEDGYEIIESIIKNTNNVHYEEKETILLLQYIDISHFLLTYDKILSFLELFTNCQIHQNLCNLYKDTQQLLEKDYEYGLKQKDKEIEILLQQIKEIKSHEKLDFQPISIKPEDFESDIFKACKEGKLLSVQWLIEKENIDKYIRVEKRDYKFDLYEDDTPIHIASKYGHLPLVQYLIEKQNVDKDIKGYYEKTPLHYACEKGHLPIADYLISKGAYINTKDKFGSYVIHSASKGGLLPIVQYLIEKQNIDKDIKGFMNKTPLICSCSNSLPIVEYLISKGANIEAKNANMWTPLFIAMNYRQIEILTYLVSKGANINAKDKYGKTSLHYASYWGYPDIVKYLVSQGANKNIKDNDGKTPYDLAKNDEIKNIIK